MNPGDTREEWLVRHRTLGEFERVGYAGLGEAYNRRLYHLRRKHFLRLLQRHDFDPAGRILDVGSGTGFYVDCYCKLGARRVSGVELSADAVGLLAARHPDFAFATCDIVDGLPVEISERGPFELVSAMDVLFHITADGRWRQALRHCGEAVAPGGVLLVSDNFPGATLPANASQSFHTLAEHEAVLSAAKFKLIEVSPVFFVSNGQVSAGGWGGAVMTAYWRGVSGVICRALRRSRGLGEWVGGAAGVTLTAMDSILQRQSMWRGYSTKVAVFRRNE